MEFKGAFVLFPVVLTIILADCVGSSGGMTDCGTDLVCFYASAKLCTPAKVLTEQSQLSIYLEVKPASGTCNIYTEVKSAPDAYSSIVGKSMLCPNPENFTGMTADFINSCSGSLVEAINSYLYPTEANTCADGTAYDQCSSTKPKYCDNGELVDNCFTCGCPSGKSCNQSSQTCYSPVNAQTCSDGTSYSQCSAIKPKYCSSGTLINSCSLCGCLANQVCNSIEQTLLTGDSVTATDGYKVHFDSVVQSGNVFYAIFTATDPQGINETSSQLVNGYSYSFFANKLKVMVNQVGYNQTVFKGYANAKISSGATESLCFVPVTQNTCSDGTSYGQCSITKPKYCNNGVLTDSCSACSCITGQSCNQTSNVCHTPQTNQTQYCAGGTPFNQCSTTKPKYCSNGNLVDLCPTCGCPTNQVCNATTNVCYTPPQVCSDGTSYNQCSQNKPLYCSNGTLIINCVTCGCSSGYSCNITSKICYTPLCNDGTAYDQCSATKPNYCQNGSLILNCNSCGCPTGKYCDLSENSCYSQLIKVNMLTQDVVYTTNNYLVKLDSVVQSGNVYYGIFTVTNSSGQSESSTLLTNGITYYFFNNRIGITVQEIGYDLTLFKGVTNITVTKTFPKVKMYTNDIVYTMQNYKIKFTSVSLSNGKYYGIFTATNPSQQTETSTLLTNGITYHFFNNEMGITINEIGYDFDLFKGVTNITVH